MSALAFALALASAAAHAGWNLAARSEKGEFCVLWLGLCLSAAAALPLAWLNFGPETARAWPYLAASSAINALYFFVLAKAYASGPLSEVYPVARGTGVVAAAAASRWLLGEALQGLAAAGIVCVCAGLCLVSGRGDAAATRRGALWALAAGLCIGGSAVVDKLAMRSASPVAYIVALCAGAALFSAPYALSQRARLARAWSSRKARSFLIGAGSMLSYGLILSAFKLGPLGPLAALRESSIAFGALLGVAFLGERLTRLRATGVAAIVAGLILIRVA